MPRHPSLLNVRKHLEFVAEYAEDLLARDGQHTNGLRLAPIDRETLNQIRFLSRAILRRADKRRTAGNRKDLYVEAGA
jgi:hypothetical protein